MEIYLQGRCGLNRERCQEKVKKKKKKKKLAVVLIETKCAFYFHPCGDFVERSAVGKTDPGWRKCLNRCLSLNTTRSLSPLFPDEDVAILTETEAGTIKYLWDEFLFVFFFLCFSSLCSVCATILSTLMYLHIMTRWNFTFSHLATLHHFLWHRDTCKCWSQVLNRGYWLVSLRDCNAATILCLSTWNIKAWT